MNDRRLADLPPDLREMLRSIPPPDVVRNRLTKLRDEAAFLRRLLRLAVDAERQGGRTDG